MFHDSQKSDGLLNSLDIDRLHDGHNRDMSYDSSDGKRLHDSLTVMCYVTAVTVTEYMTTATATAAIVVFLHYSRDSDRLHDSSSSAVYVQLVVYYSKYDLSIVLSQDS